MSLNTFRISMEEALGAPGQIVYLQNGRVGLATAYEINDSCSLQLKIPRSVGATQVKIAFFEGKNNTEIAIFDSAWLRAQGTYDVYSTAIPIKRLGVGLYFFRIEIISVCGAVYGYKNKRNIEFTDKKVGALFQISVSDFKYNAPQQYYGGTIYQIFVDRFARGGNVPRKPSNVYVEDWDAPLPEYPEYLGAPVKNNYFYGGTLYGILEKLDYISSLGVNLIYLSPIFVAASNHKYDTADYMRVDSSFGGDEALRLLIDGAKQRGIGIILDGVFNHTGADSIYFNKFSSYKSLGAYQSVDSEYYDWYEFQSHPDQYTSWWDIEILPRINPDKKTCRAYFVGQDGVVEKYARMGIAGMRLDVVDELSDSFTMAIKDKLSEFSDSSILYGEVWEDASNKIAYGKRKEYYLGGELDGVMNYPLMRGIISYIRDKSTDALEYALCEVMENAPKRIRDMQMNILGSHDTERIITVLGGERSTGKSNSELFSLAMSDAQYEKAKGRLIAAYTVISTLPGIPTVFYGDEAGQEGYSDPFNRRPFPWDKIDVDILSHYRKMGAIRRAVAVYGDGEFKLLYLSKNLLIFARYNNTDTYITAYNNSNHDVEIRFSKKVTSPLTDIRSDTYIIEGESAGIFKASKNTTIKF